MPTKKVNGTTRYAVSGKTFTWTTEDGDTAMIPMRVKLKTIRALAGKDMDAAVMFEMLESIAPGQSEVFDEMDVNDFQQMFVAWQAEYTKLNGATPGE